MQAKQEQLKSITGERHYEKFLKEFWAKFWAYRKRQKFRG